MINILIFGAPGSGKGTQSVFLKERYDLDHISTGDMLRSEMKAGTEIGKKAADIINSGNLVPDEVISEMLRNRVAKTVKDSKGFLFDGYPRTLHQAETLDEILKSHGSEVTALVMLHVPETELITRIIERGKVSGRADDNEESVKERLKVYHEETEPVIDYYRQKDKVLEVNGMGSIEEITGRILHEVDNFTKG